MDSQDIRNLKNVLESEIKKSFNVFIIGHNSPDFDSIGSCMGIYQFVSSLNGRPYIIINDEYSKIESGVKRIIDENRNVFSFIHNSDFRELLDRKSLLIVCDTNKKNMISIEEMLPLLKNIIVIDHHSEDDNTILTKNKFIYMDVSSCCEIVTRVLNASKIKYPASIANYLLAGISLDTKRFKYNTSSKTHDVAEKLIDRGADIDYVNNLFLEEFESFCRISNFIANGTIIKKYSESLAPIQVSFTLNRDNPHTIYLREDFAKAADKMLKFNGIDASFALGYLNPTTIHISARGGKKVNVGKILSTLHGGGNAQSAGCLLESDDIFQVESILMDMVSCGLSVVDDKLYEEPRIVKIKQLKKNKKN